MNLLNYICSKARFISIALLLSLISASIGGIILLKGLTTQYSIQQFMNPDNPLIMAEFKVKDAFALPEWPAIYVNISLNSQELGTFLEPERISRLKAATESASTLSGVNRSLSIATVQGASSVKDQLTVGKILDLTPASKWDSRILTDPLLTPSLISMDGRTVLVAVGLSQFDTTVLESLPDQLRNQFKEQFPQSMIRIGGIPAIQNEMGQLLKKELSNFLLLALIACLATLAAFFRDKISMIVPLLLVALANIGALSWMVVAKIPFTVLSTTLPVLVSLIVLSIVTHTMIGFSEDWASAKRASAQPDKARVLLKTLRALFLPNFLTALTTSLGFAALLGAAVPLIHQYAESVAVGVLIAWACVTVSLPAILFLIPVPKPRSWTASKARWVLHVMKHRRFIIVSVGIIAVAFAWEGRKLNWSARLFDDLPEQREARISSEQIDKNLGGLIPLDVVIGPKLAATPERDAWNNPSQIQQLNAILERTRKMDGVGSAIGLSDFIQAGSRAQNRPLPDSRAGVAELIFLYSLSEDRIINQFLTPDGSQTRLSVRIRDIPGDQMIRLVNQIHDETQMAFPDLEVQTVGMAANVHPINNELCKDLIYGFWQAILLISAVLVLIFRSIRWTLMAMVPNLISPISLIGMMAFNSTPIKPGIALIFSIALGIAYNNTVYLLGRVRLLNRKAQDRGSNHSFAKEEFPIVKAWYQEGNPCVFSTLALVGGFAVFLASYFSLNRVFGAYMLLSIFAGMLGDLIFLPALLGEFPNALGSPKLCTTNRRTSIDPGGEPHAEPATEEVFEETAHLDPVA